MGDSVAIDEVTYSAAVKCLTEKVEVKDRTYYLKTYKTCFIGTEAVNVLVDNHICLSRDQAVGYIQTMMDAGLLIHATLEHRFEDEHLFYRFMIRDTAGAPMFDATTFNAAVGCVKQKVEVRDRMYHLKQFEHCFLGNEAVDVLCYNHIALGREQAVDLIQCMMDIKLLHHVTYEHAFKDAPLFYRFIDQCHTRYDEKTFNDSYECLRAKVEARDRHHLLKTYRNCFLGNEAVDVIVNNHFAINREEAVLLIRAMQDAQLLNHVTNERRFKDQSLFYHFIERSGVIGKTELAETEPEKQVTGTELPSGGV